VAGGKERASVRASAGRARSQSGYCSDLTTISSRRVCTGISWVWKYCAFDIQRT